MTRPRCNPNGQVLLPTCCPLQSLMLCFPKAKECSSRGFLHPLCSTIVTLLLPLPHKAPIASTEQQQETSPSMVNFPIDPAPFIPSALHIEDGGPQRTSLAMWCMRMRSRQKATWKFNPPRPQTSNWWSMGHWK
jgi:hypothetical protein